VAEAGERWVCAQRHMWKIRVMMVSKLGIPSMGVGPSGNAPFMSVREVAVVEDMVIGVIRKSPPFEFWRTVKRTQ
jgi:hypothetical protein